MQEFENKQEKNEKIIDIKGTFEDFIEEEKPELSQEEAIKAYKKGDVIEYPNKKKKTEDEATQNDLNAINGLNEWIDNKTNRTNANIVVSTDAFSATVVLNPAENEAQPTFEQKKEIAAILCNFSSYEELTKEYGDKISQLNMTEEHLEI